MTSKEKEAVKYAVERIKSLASLENARFGIDTEKDKDTKQTVRPYLMWFENVAQYLEDLANAEDKYDTQNAIDKIFRYCN